MRIVCFNIVYIAKAFDFLLNWYAYTQYDLQRKIIDYMQVVIWSDVKSNEIQKQ